MKVIDETGNVYNDLEVIGRDFSKQGRKYWFCKCKNCGKIFSYSGTKLRQGKISGCPDCKKDNQQKEEIGNRYGHLTVIDFAYIKDRRYYWKCKCDCGNIENISGRDLRNGTRTQCLQCNKENRVIQYIDETGKRYGHLTVIEYDKEKSGKNAYWKCKCDCGNIISVEGAHLREGHTISCGCIKSKGEEKINQILTENNINYKTQVSFNDLRNKNLLRFDFGIYKDNILQYLIEFDGEQHINKNNQWYSEEGVKRDNLKNEYCLNNNIPLIRIPYKKLDTLNIQDLLLDITGFLIKGD